MAFITQSPGSCGEFIQGVLGGQRFLVTCPINRYSMALSDVSMPLRYPAASLQHKSICAKKITLDYLSCDKEIPVYLHSYIAQEKGMASSSADISAVCQAAALACGRSLSWDELALLALRIEPTDVTFYPGTVQFDYLKGRLNYFLGKLPVMTILVYDTGGEVNTVEFNGRTDLTDLRKRNESIMENALWLFKSGLAQKKRQLIGKAATMSAFANQSLLYKEDLSLFHDIGRFYGSCGTIVAHSGTVMGLIFCPQSPNIVACRQELAWQLPQLDYVDTVETTNSGLTYCKVPSK